MESGFGLLSDNLTKEHFKHDWTKMKICPESQRKRESVSCPVYSTNPQDMNA